MKITISAELRHGGRSGVEARAPQLRLTSHGIDNETALESLRKGIVAWCNGLRSIGKLEKAVRYRKLKWEPDGEGIELELQNSSKVLK